MTDKIELTLQERTVHGKAVKALRKQGLVPAVLYGHDYPAHSVMAAQVPMTKAYRTAGKHHPVELRLGRQKHLAMIKSADIDPAKHNLRHLAFHVIQQNETVETEVPIVIEGSGETAAEKAGLVVLTTIDSVQIEALPANLPDNLQAPGDKLVEIGDHLTVADLKVPSGVRVLSEPGQIVATVYEPSALQAANDAAGGEAEVGDETEVAAEQGGEEAADQTASASDETTDKNK